VILIKTSRNATKITIATRAGLLGMNLWQWALKKVTRIHSAHLSEDE
jgi:hypothetical protein